MGRELTLELWMTAKYRTCLGQEKPESTAQSYRGLTAVRKCGTRGYTVGGAKVLTDLMTSIGLETRHAWAQFPIR